MTILILSPFYSPNIGGVETHLTDLCRHLTGRKGHRVYVVTYVPLTTRIRGRWYEKNGSLTIIRVPWIGKDLFHKFESHPATQFLYLTPVLFIATLIFMIFKGGEIKVIHAHGFTAALITNIISKFFPRKTLVVSMHAIYGFSKNKKLAFICKNILLPFNKIFCLAQRSVDDLLAAGVDNKRLSIYTQWVDQSLFKPREKSKCREKIDLKDKFTVLYPPGRLIEKKGAGVLLEAVKSCSKSIQFIFVGTGPLEEKIFKATKEYSNVFFAGRRTQGEAAYYYGAADVVVVPSQYEEGFARVVLETLSCGRPIISSNLGCLPEMITAQVGFLVKPSAKNIAEKINYLYKNRSKLAYLTRNARPYALKHFSEKNAEKIELSYFKSS